MKNPAEKPKKFRWKMIAGVAVLIGVVLLARHLHEFILIDSCFDNGGRWNYKKNACEYEE